MCAALSRPGVDVRQAVLDIGDAGGVGGTIRLGQQRGAFGIGLQHGIEKRGRGRRHLLRHAADFCAAGQADHAAFQRQFALYQAEQRGLARAVAANKADLMAGGNIGRRRFQQRATFDGIADICQAEHRHALPHGRAKVNDRRVLLRPSYPRPSGYSAGPLSSSLLPNGSRI